MRRPCDLLCSFRCFVAEARRASRVEVRFVRGVRGQAHDAAAALVVACVEPQVQGSAACDWTRDIPVRAATASKVAKRAWCRRGIWETPARMT